MTENKTPDAGPEELRLRSDDEDTEGHLRAIPEPDGGPDGLRLREPDGGPDPLRLRSDDEDTETHLR